MSRGRTRPGRHHSVRLTPVTEQMLRFGFLCRGSPGRQKVVSLCLLAAVLRMFKLCSLVLDVHCLGYVLHCGGVVHNVHGGTMEGKGGLD